MPSAYRDTTGEDNLPRDYLCPAHNPSVALYPALLDYEHTGTCLWKHPATWNGFARFRLWLYGYATNANWTINVTIHAGTCGEGNANHTESHSIDVNITQNQFTCVDLLTTWATVIALLADCDMVTIDVFNEEEEYLYCYGVEIVES